MWGTKANNHKLGERGQSSLAGSEILKLEQYPVDFGCSLTKEGGAPDNKLITMSATIMIILIL